MFASSSVTQHLTRGLIGFTAMYFGMRWLTSGAGSGVVFGAGVLALSVFVLRGCPACWTIGLAQTLYAKIAGRKNSERVLGETVPCEGACPLR